MIMADRMGDLFDPANYTNGVPLPRPDPRGYWEIVHPATGMTDQEALVFQQMPRLRGINSMVRQDRFHDALTRMPEATGQPSGYEPWSYQRDAERRKIGESAGLGAIGRDYSTDLYRHR
jgi:hypothetical protein